MNDQQYGQRCGQERRRQWQQQGAGCLLALLLLVVGTGAARAQGLRTEAGKIDLQIVAMPYSNGQWGVSVVYPRVVPHAQADSQIKRLGTVAGWQVSPIQFEDRGMGTRRVNRQPVTDTADMPMTSASFTTTAALADWQNGTLAVEPFVRAFRDLSHVNITYLMSPNFNYRGLRRHSDPNLDLVMNANTNAYTYQLTIKNHRVEAMSLPRYEILKPGGSTHTAANGAATDNRGRIVGTVLVVVLAAGVGLLVFAWMNRATSR